ncbi:MAG: hypothetical protein RQ982_05545, partial [Gammaproteobacteria bacterium]|nr:hypothetical protein [Gammaproteobacteria bacterium]
TLQSEHFYVHYAEANKAERNKVEGNKAEGNKEVAERATAIAEAAYLRLTEELNWWPKEKTHVILSDEADRPNGFATPVFFNRTVLYLVPPTSVNTLEDFDDWFSTLIFHEYTHIIHLDKSSGSPEYLRKIFGRFLFLFPNLFQPSWVTEGLATYKETDTKRGIGRGQSAMFASMMREELVNGLQPINHVNLPVSTWPAGATRYLYGVYFMAFIADRYGEDKILQWIEGYSNNLIPFMINTNARETLGNDLAPLWKEYQQWLTEKFQPQIDAITAKGIKAGKQFSQAAYRTDSVVAVAEKKGDAVYYVRDAGYEGATLMFVDAQGNSEQLVSLNNGASLAAHSQAGLLLTQDEICDNYALYSDIYLYVKEKNELKRLTECGRYLYVSWFPDGRQMAAVHNDAGHFELQLLDNDAIVKKVLWRAEQGEIIGQIDVSPDASDIVASVWRKTDGWNIELFNIEQQRWQKITTGVSIATNPRYDAAGDILFSMERDGVYNLQRYDTSTKKTEQLSNLIGGAFESSQASVGGAIYYSGYSANGYAIYRMDDDSAFEETPTFNDRLQLIEYPVTSHKAQDYSALSTMSPRWWLPTFYATDQRTQWGLTTAGSDALDIHRYAVSASYDTQLDKPAGQIYYSYSDRLFFSVTRENDIYLDANGDVDRIAKHDKASAVWAFPNNHVQRQTNILLNATYDKSGDKVPVSGAAPVSNFKDNLLGIGFLYNSANINPLSISLSDGMGLRLVAEDSSALGSDYSGQVYTLDWRQYIRTGRESVLALRFVQGWGSEQPRPFELGGEGPNINAANVLFGVSGEAVFDVRKYALRGYQEGLPQLQGRRVQLLTGEWRFPLQRSEDGIMAPPVGIMQWFGTVFAETGSAYQDSADKYYSDAGLEITVDMALFYNVILRTRIGYAHGFDREIGDDRVYVKIGSSF